MITVETNIPVYGVEPKHIFNPPYNQFVVLDFHKDDWPNILLSLQSIDWISTLELIPPSSCFDYFIDTLYEARHHKRRHMSRFFNIEIHTYSYSRICHLQFKQINPTLCHSPVKLEQFRYSNVGI